MHWYIVPRTAPLLGMPCRINSIDWRDNRVNPSPVGEVTFADRPFDGWGRIVPPIPGDHLCGTAEDFAHGGRYLPDLPPFPRAADGIPLCCRPPLGGVRLGGPTWSVAVSPGGAKLGGTTWVPAPVGLQVFPSAAVEINPDNWYAVNQAITASGWVKFASTLGDVWAVDFRYGFTPDPATDFPRILVFADDPGGMIPWDSLTDTLGVVTHNPDPFGSPFLWLGWFWDTFPTAGWAFRVRRLP